MDTDHQYRKFGLPGNHALQKQARQARKRHLEMVRSIREGTRSKPANFSSTLERVALSIPELDFAVLKVRYPELVSTDRETRDRAWQKFVMSPESEPYRIDRLSRGVLKK